MSQCLFLLSLNFEGVDHRSRGLVPQTAQSRGAMTWSWRQRPPLETVAAEAKPGASKHLKRRFEKNLRCRTTTARLTRIASSPALCGARYTVLRWAVMGGTDVGLVPLSAAAGGGGLLRRTTSLDKAAQRQELHELELRRSAPPLCSRPQLRPIES